MKYAVMLLMVFFLVTVLGGCGSDTPYKLSYKVRPRDERILATEKPIYSNTEIAIFVESLDGDSILKSCRELFRDYSTGKLNGKPDLCFVPADGAVMVLGHNRDVPLPKGTPVNIGHTFQPNVFRAIPDHFILKTDKGEFKVRVDPEEYKKVVEEYRVEERKAVEKAIEDDLKKQR